MLGGAVRRVAARVCVPAPGVCSGTGCVQRNWVQECIRWEGTPEVALDRRLKEVAKSVGGGYRRFQNSLSLALAASGTVTGHRLGALGGGEYLTPPFQCIPGDRVYVAVLGVCRGTGPLYPQRGHTGTAPIYVIAKQAHGKWVRRVVAFWGGGGLRAYVCTSVLRMGPALDRQEAGVRRVCVAEMRPVRPLRFSGVVCTLHVLGPGRFCPFPRRLLVGGPCAQRGREAAQRHRCTAH